MTALAKLSLLAVEEGSTLLSVPFLRIYVFVLAGFVGFQIITKVPALLHTPLMSATNAISGISLVGSLVAAGATIDETAFKADLAFIKAEIKYEVDNELFGAEEARRNLTGVDPQAQAALSFFDEAGKLIAAKKGQ